MKTVQDYQLSKHELFLDGFLKLFQDEDTDQNGIINEEEFYRLLENMEIGVTEQMSQEFLNQLDPCNFQKITFSDIIQLLSTQKPDSLPEEQTTGHRDSCNFNESSINTTMPLSDKVQNMFLLDERFDNHVKRPSTNKP